MRRTLVPGVAVLVAVTAGSIASAAELESGLQLGDRTKAYNVNDCTGPNAGKSLCYR